MIDDSPHRTKRGSALRRPSTLYFPGVRPPETSAWPVANAVRAICGRAGSRSLIHNALMHVIVGPPGFVSNFAAQVPAGFSENSLIHGRISSGNVGLSSERQTRVPRICYGDAGPEAQRERRRQEHELVPAQGRQRHIDRRQG